MKNTEKLQQELEKYPVSTEAKRILDERIELRKKLDEETAKFALCIRELICPTCGKDMEVDTMPRIATFKDHQHTGSLQKKIVKCECGFNFEIKDEKAKK